MIEFTTGDILAAEAEALVNSVNCVGVMGRGIALQFKNAYPQNFKAYKRACDRGDVQPGRMFVFETGLLANPKYIINFPTKRHWRGKSRMEDIEAGLVALVEEIERRGIRSVALPPLGSGLGGLHWPEVRSRIEHTLSALPDVRAVVFEPDKSMDTARTAQSLPVPAMTPGRAALVGLVHSYLRGALDPFVSLLEVHKLMYFLQESGEELNLDYTAAPYGPYAAKLRHVLNRIEGHLIVGSGIGGDLPNTQLQLVPGAIEEVQQFLAKQPETRAHFDRVVDLVEGFETPSGLELLSTVHWVAEHGAGTNLDRVVADVYAWGARKKQFSPRQIGLALDVLTKKGWIAPIDTNHSGSH